MTLNPSVSLSLDVPPLQLSDPISKLHLGFTSSLHIQLPDSTWLMDLKWKELEFIRGPGFCLKIKLRWHGQSVRETLIEEFGRWVSGAEMWSQLLLSTSLQIPERVDIGVDFEETEEVEPDILTATELLLPKILPTASLIDITLDFFFSSNKTHSSHGASPTLQELMPLTDTAIHSLWSDKILCLAPILGKVGYLEGVSEKSEYINLITDMITNVAARSRGETLGEVVDSLGGSGGIGIKVWKVLLGTLKAKKGGPGSILKSLIRTSEGVVDTRKLSSSGGEDDLLLFDERKESEGEELLFCETGSEDDFLIWDEGELGRGDSIFNWTEDEDEDDTSLFEAFDNQVMGLGCYANKNDFFPLEHHEQAPETALFQRAEDEDMIWI